MKQNNYKFTKAALLISMLSISFSASAEKSSFQSAGMKEFPMMTSVLPGAGTLVRTKHTATATLAMSGLDTNAAYTVWWTVYNKPENCANGPGSCSVFDLNNPAACPSVFYATGFVTGNDGVANVTTHLKAGDLPMGYDVMIPGGLKRGNGFKAEIVLAVRTHGDIIADKLASQIDSYSGACNENYCAETHLISFPPMQ